MKFVVEPAVFEALPTVCFGVVAARGVDNTAVYPAIDALLSEGVAACEAMFAERKVKEHPAILPYREAFEALGINPNKFMSSIEALFTRVAKGKGMPRISPVVDAGNAVSLRHIVPIGAHDIDRMDADIEVRFSREGDTFLPFGESEAERMEAGELIYVVGDKVRTRRWIWRQSELGKIGGDCRNVFYPIDGFAANKDAVMAAREQLAALCKDVLGAEVSVGWVDAQNHSFEL